MSRHEIERTEEARKWVFGWDQPLQSFFLQVHRLDVLEEDEEKGVARILYFGASPETTMYEVEDLVHVARQHGLTIPGPIRTKLWGEKDDGV